MSNVLGDRVPGSFQSRGRRQSRLVLVGFSPLTFVFDVIRIRPSTEVENSLEG
jgi:hypothetical protein